MPGHPGERKEDAMYEKGMVMDMMLLWMIVCGIALAALFPLLLRLRRRRARRAFVLR